MTIDETYNIHKIINCMFRHFKSKWLCKHNKHNYELHSKIENIPVITEKTTKEEIIENHKIWKTYWKCRCCGKEIEFYE